MDDRTTETALSLTKFGIGQPVPRSEDPDAGARRGPLHRRHQPAGPGLCGDGAQPRRPWRHPRHRHRRRQGDAGGARGLYRRRSRRLRHAQMRTAAQKPRRLADPLYAAAGACRRQGALCRRSGRLRDRRDRRASQGRRRGGGARYRAAAPGAHRPPTRSSPARRSFSTRCRTTSHSITITAMPRRSPPPSPRPRTSRACRLSNQRMVVNAMEPRAAIGEIDAAGKWTLYSSSQGVFGMKTTLMDILSARRRQGARGHRPGRRLVRHEGVRLSGIYLHPARRPRARAPGEMDRRAFRQLRLRPSRPRPGHDGGNRLRRGRRISWRCGCPAMATWAAISPIRAAALDRQPGQEHRQHLPHAADRSGDKMRIHQHHVRLRLSRRRPAGRAIITSNARSTSRRWSSASTASSCASAT